VGIFLTEFLFWFCAFATLYPYVAFPAILWICSTLVNESDFDDTPIAAGERLAPFTIVVLAHNEEGQIAGKIADTLPVLETNPQNVLLVVSDYSSDNTVAVGSAIGHAQVQVVENKRGRGRALASNFAAGLARNEYLVFTDVETRVPTETVRAMVGALGRGRTGCVNAEIEFRHKPGDEVSEAAGLYWRFEMFLRTVETRLGLYATASGPCMGVRRSLFRDLPPTGDVDFTTPLDVVEQGYRCAHLRGYVAYDVMPPNARAEFKARTRQVAKNFSGTISRWGLRNIVWHPLYTWALYSHKVMRWLVPFFLLGALLANLALVGGHWIYDFTFAVQAAVYLMAVLGWVGYRKNKSWPVAQKAYAFALSQVAFFVGVLKAANGAIPAFYIPSKQV
jgi:poly-beta-1,6-N-acetyl-D-glucosamine synthase